MRGNVRARGMKAGVGEEVKRGKKMRRKVGVLSEMEIGIEMKMEEGARVKAGVRKKAEMKLWMRKMMGRMVRAIRAIRRWERMRIRAKMKLN